MERENYSILMGLERFVQFGGSALKRFIHERHENARKNTKVKPCKFSEYIASYMCTPNGCTLGEAGMNGTVTKKETRLSIRTTPESKDLLERAAKKENKNLSDFVLDNALSAAEAIVADDANFSLDKKQWKKFVAALDAPPRNIPALRKLLTEPGVFDEK